jgi:hypothetical protein
MNREYGDACYSTISVQNDQDGYAGLELHRISSGKDERIATVLFWDACGQFFVETFDSDLPLAILEELVWETKEKVKTK